MNKKIMIPITLLCAFGLVACNGSSNKNEKMAADAVFYNGHVITMDGNRTTGTSLAVKDGKIVGIDVPVSNYSDSEVELIDLKNNTIVPGFIDAHGHFAMVAQSINFANLSPSPVGTSDSIPLLVQTMQEFWKDKELAEDQWLVGTGYDDSLLAEKTHPTRYDLDQVSTEIPIVIVHVSFHLAVVNSKALELLEIDETTEDPAGGKIVRIVGTNTPNGVLEETAMYLAMEGLNSAPQTPENTINAFNMAQDYYASFGITTIQDGAASPESIRLYEAMGNKDVLFLDVAAYPTWDAYTMLGIEGYKTSQEYANHFRIAGVKMILDGSPQGKTAFMTQPYLNPPIGESNDYVGYAALTKSFLEQKLRGYLDSGTQFIIHTNGDASVDLLLDTLDDISLESDNFELIRPVSIHSQTTRDDQLERMVGYNMIPSFFSAHTFFWGDWHVDEVFGIERAERISPTRSASNLGIQYTTHNDSPVVDPDIIRLMYNTVNRRTRSGKTLGNDQKATPYEALRSVTINAAYQYFEEDLKGSLEVGKIADLVILSDNPLTVSPDKINEIEVLSTYKNGINVYLK